MPVIRTEKHSHYVAIRNETLEDTRLSWAARGLLAYLLTKPPSWEVHAQHLIQQGPAGRDAVYAILRELESAGYLTKEPSRQGGKYAGTDWVVWETPAGADGPSLGAPCTDKPYPDKPYPDNPCPSKDSETVIPDTYQAPSGEGRATPDAGSNGGGRSAAEEPLVEQAERVIAYLNDRTGRAFRARKPSGGPTRAVEGHLLPRLRDGYSVEECYSVVANRVAAWGSDPKMAQYLRPETLFRASKFESYLGDALAAAPTAEQSAPAGGGKKSPWERIREANEPKAGGY